MLKIEFCKKLWLKYQIVKHEKILLEAGIEEAYKQRKNIQMGLGEKLVTNKDVLENIYLPKNEQGQLDISPLLFLGAKQNPEEARKYVLYQKILDKLRSSSETRYTG